MGVVADSPRRSTSKPALAPERRPSLREDSSPVKPKRRGLRLPSDFQGVASRFTSLVGEGELPHAQCLVLLLACNYDPTDIVTTMAIASANVLRQEHEFQQMGERERVFLAAIHIYLAHVFVFDECVPLRYWHEWAFAKYCTFGCLNRTLGKLLRLMHYQPTVDPDIVRHNVAYLRGEEANARPAALKGTW